MSTEWIETLWFQGRDNKFFLEYRIWDSTTPCGRSLPSQCHHLSQGLSFNSLLPALIPLNMQQEGRRDRSLPRACCGEDAHGIDSISPPCPHSLIAPQQTCAVGNLPAVCAQGFSLGAGLGRVWVRWEDLRLFSLLCLYWLPTGETSWLFFLGHSVLLCYLLSFKPSIFSANPAFVCLKQTGKPFPCELQSLCLYLLSEIHTMDPKSEAWPREQD